MALLRSAKRTTIAAAQRAGVLRHLLNVKRHWSTGRAVAGAIRPASRPDVRRVLRSDRFRTVLRRTGVYLASPIDEFDPVAHVANTIGTVTRLLSELGIGHTIVHDERAEPVVLIDADRWLDLRSLPSMESTPWDLHVVADDRRATDQPLRFLPDDWVSTDRGAVSGFRCFLARCGESPESLVGRHFPVTVRATSPESRPDVNRGLTTGDERTIEWIRRTQAPPFPIDAVFTWVDGDDPAWRERKSRVTGEEFKPSADASADHRFKSRDELRYSLRSIQMYAPWIQKIYVVTDRQRPWWLTDDDRVSVIDHTEIIPSEFLPTFNSHVIESCLFRIEGLSEHYLYFNDDILIGAPVTWGDFFTRDGLARYFRSSAPIPAPWAPLKTIDYANLNAQRLLRQRFGVDIDRKIRHTPYAQRRAVHEWMVEDFADEVERTRRAALRSATDQSFAAYLHHYVGDELGLTTPSGIRSDYFDIADPDLASRLRGQHERVAPVRVFCINDADQSSSDASGADIAIRRFFEAAYPFTPPWEATESKGD